MILHKISKYKFKMFRNAEDDLNELMVFEGHQSLIKDSAQKKYLWSNLIKFLHLLTFDTLNIVLCALNYYTIGIITNSLFALIHVVIFFLDIIFRKMNCKREKKYSQLIFDALYFVSTYLVLLSFLLYLFSYTRNPIS